MGGKRKSEKIPAEREKRAAEGVRSGGGFGPPANTVAPRRNLN